ncbi:MAG TPA: hypothetical protein VFN23_08475, partial [Ktedonobacteraceae bacterium]|nr:hypothetical protein [Ktedonobacteraceae bacterium]
MSTPINISNPSNSWWQQLRHRLTLAYLIIIAILLSISIAGQVRLLADVGHTFGGFYWAVDTDGQVVVVTTPVQLPPFAASPGSLTSADHIIMVNGASGPQALTRAYQHAHPGDMISYTIARDQQNLVIKRPVSTYTWDMWWQSYGLTLLAGVSWLLAGAILLATAPGWLGAVEGMTLLPPAFLLLLYSHWGNVQATYPADIVFQLLWVPSFALLGAAFIHLSLIYRPKYVDTPHTPSVKLDALPYLPLIPLVLFEWAAFLFTGHVPTRINLILSLSYAVVGGLVGFVIGVYSLLRIGGIVFPGTEVPEQMRRRIVDLLTLWIGGIGLGFCLGVLPIFLSGNTLLPFPIFLTLSAAYPLLLLYAIRYLRLIDRLHITLAEREEALVEQRKTAGKLQETNSELQQATSLLLHADAHLRSILSQRIHDQPKQQALRIRSLLGHWQNKLKQEADHDRSGRVAAQPVIEVLGKVRKISEELEGDLRGLQMLVEDAYQRRSLGLRLHLEKLIQEDLPALHPESPLQIQADLWALDAPGRGLEQTPEGERIA